MQEFLKGKDLELQDIVQKDPKVPMAKDDKGIVTSLNNRSNIMMKMSRIFRRMTRPQRS